MKLKIINNPESLKKEAESFFSASFCHNLKKTKPGTYLESLVARYEIQKNKNNFSSISHKQKLVFIATSENRIGVDIEIYKERGESLLDNFTEEEYEKLGGKNWDNFYILWTAKESCIKIFDLRLEDMDKIMLVKTKNNKAIISGLEFFNRSILCYNHIEKTVYSGENGNTIYSICLENNIVTK